MNVHIGSTTDDPRKLTKTITWITNQQGTPQDFSCVPTADCDIINPTIILAYDSNIVTKNYAAISDWGRKYFINDIQMLTGGRMMLALSVDVLATYAAEIVECVGTAIRSESAGINKISDSKYPVNTCRYVLDVVNYSRTPFTRNPSSPYILTTIGGDAT